MHSDRSASDESYPRTRWSLIDLVQKEGIEGARPRLAELLTLYRPAMMAYLVSRMRLRPDDAEELLQGFVADRILEHGLIDGASRARGRFRGLVLTALRNYVADQCRLKQAGKRQPAGAEVFPLDNESIAMEPGAIPSRTFDIEWARNLLAETLRRVQAECAQSGQAKAWGMLECRVIKPLLEGCEPLPYETLVERFGFESPIQASNTLATAKRMFDRCLRSVVGEYAADEEEIESEIRYLRDVLAESAARCDS